MILVTGADGFLGRAVIAELQVAGQQVMPLHHGPYVEVNVASWTADLTDAAHIEFLKQVCPFPEVVIHLAAHVAIGLQPDPLGADLPPIPAQTELATLYATNVLGTANLAELCLHRQVRHLVFASSQAVYGFPDAAVVSETYPCKPLEHYAVSKHCAELLLERVSAAGLAVTVMRISGIYSEQRREGAVYRFCKSALSSRLIELDAKLPLPIDVIHLQDVADAVCRAATRAGVGWRLLNVATGEPCSLRLLAEDIVDLVEGASIADHAVSQPSFALAVERAQEWLGWKAQPRRQRLRQMIEYLRARPSE